MDRSKWMLSVGIALMHLLVVVALIRGPALSDWLAFALLYPLGAIGVGIAMHRYFAHGAFSTSRGFQFLLALCAALSFGNALFFAGKHRIHHRHSDREGDVHAPAQGLWHCWFGSLLDCGYEQEEIEAEIRDHLSAAELQWLYRHSAVPGLVICALLFSWGGFSAMVIGGLLGPVLLLHQSSAVNYFCHVSGYRRFLTHDASTNNPLVALLTYGEGWHHNHHRFPRAAHAGMRWWEIDVFYYVICLFEALGLIWGVQRIEPARRERARTQRWSRVTR
ncbi:MAG: acyl-CoA desaturase [Halioglobus sp.]|nr:acyl-CoA desaturase [Halioglobus sp.]